MKIQYRLLITAALITQISCSLVKPQPETENIKTYEKISSLTGSELKKQQFEYLQDKSNFVQVIEQYDNTKIIAYTGILPKNNTGLPAPGTDKLVRKIISYIEDYHNVKHITVNGYSSRGVTYEDKVNSSLYTANYVASFIWDYMHLDINKVSINGMANKDPIIKNMEERSTSMQNERVEIILT